MEDPTLWGRHYEEDPAKLRNAEFDHLLMAEVEAAFKAPNETGATP